MCTGINKKNRLKYKLKEILKERKLTYQKAAFELGIHASTVQKWCLLKITEEESINKKNIDLICKTFSLTPKDLFNIPTNREVKQMLNIEG